jgi:hypothetical protein
MHYIFQIARRDELRCSHNQEMISAYGDGYDKCPDLILQYCKMHRNIILHHIHLYGYYVTIRLKIEKTNNSE